MGIFRGIDMGAKRACGNCKNYDVKCNCCELFGTTHEKSDAACSEWSDGKVEKRGKKK